MGLLWKKATICKYTEVHYRCKKYEMKHNIQGVEMSVCFILNGNKSSKSPAICQRAGKCNYDLISHFLLFIGLYQNLRLMQFRSSVSYDPNHWSLCHTTFLQCADCPDLVGPWGLKVVLTSEAWLECACCGSGGAEIIPCQLPRTHGALSSEGLLGSGSLGARKHKLCNKQQPHTFLYSLVSHLLEKVSVEQGHFPPAQPPTCPLCSPPPRLCVCMLMVVKGDMMVNFIYLLDWATKCAEGPSNIIFCMSMSVFLDETTFELIN